jgi:hypothetical protein
MQEKRTCQRNSLSPSPNDVRIWDNEYEFQANRTWRLRARRHADGRAIYGVYATNFQNGQTAVPGWTPETISRRQSTA